MKFERICNESTNLDFIEQIKEKFGLSEIMAKILADRGLCSIDEVEQFLRPKKSELKDPFLLKGMTEFVERIQVAKEHNEKVLIFGDYDVDGIGATAIMVGALKILGIEPRYLLPSRYVDGYGLTFDLVKKIKEEINPDLIITVDCGISCHDEVELAKSFGMDMIVTDHHEIPKLIPECIIVSTKFEDQEFKFRDLCGAGVAFKIAEALVGFDEAEQFLPITAISTIADMVSLVNENRIIVYYGLKLFNDYLPIGLKQFFKFCKIDIKKVLSTDISFRIAPRLNSPGRMGFAEDSLALYLENDLVKINDIIQKISNYNDDRVALCNRIQNECEEQIEKIDLKNNMCLVLSSSNWDQGVLGIICSRLVEEYNRPVFLFSEVNGELKGSGRSVEGINIHEMLTSIDSCIEKFGGHCMAAGLTIKKEQFEKFKAEANCYIKTKSENIVFNKCKTYDEKINVYDINNKLADELDMLEPTGIGNALPIFLVETNSINLLPLKNFPEHLNISIGKKFVGIYFGGSKCSSELIMAGTKQFLIEIQKPRYKTKQLRGQIKDFEISKVSKQNFFNVSRQTLLYQMNYFDETISCPNNVYTFKEEEMKSIISTHLNEPFGTLFVVNSHESLSWLESNFNVEKLRLSYFQISNKSLLNTIIVAPTTFEWFDKMSNIIFLDAITSNGYLQALSKFTNAKIFVPLNKSIDTSPFFGL
ncbi:MAG: single-stranded-DNA-specific exonuclease RecJ, partial [Clostridia bacterium]